MDEKNIFMNTALLVTASNFLYNILDSVFNVEKLYMGYSFIFMHTTVDILHAD